MRPKPIDMSRMAHRKRSADSIAFTWGLFGALLLIVAILTPIVANPDDLVLTLVMAHAAATGIVLLARMRFVSLVILGGFSIRVAAMFWDLYARSVYVLPNSGADTEIYFTDAVSVVQGESSHGVYAEFLGALFTLAWPSRLLGQYFNVLVGLSVIFLIARALEALQLSARARRTTLTLAAIFPTSIIMSAILLREIIPTLFVAASVLLAIYWYQTKSIYFAVMAIGSIGIGAVFHSGIVGLVPGFVVFFLLADRDTGKLRARLASIPLFAILVLVIYLGVSRFDQDLFFKFQGIENVADVFDKANSRLGDSIYLESVEIESFRDFILFGPIKALFFLLAPLPFDWRGVWDIGAFFLDSMLYFVVIYLFLRRQSSLGIYRSLVIALFIALATTALVFGVGVGNAGTAMRHRQKLTPLILVALALLLDAPRKGLSPRHAESGESARAMKPDLGH